MKNRLRDSVTIVVYSFPTQGTEEDAFEKITAAIERTWKHVGHLKTVIVVSHLFEAVDQFAQVYSDVEVQVEKTLIPGNIKTMSMDCIKRLYSRFKTPYVLIVQDDGFPLQSGLENFLGKYDFYGAPIIQDGWRRRLAYCIGLGSFNGGFSLRSYRLCAYAAKSWFRFFRFFFNENSRFLGEDFYYTTLLRMLPSTWFGFRFPSEKEAFEFSVDLLDGHVTPPENVRPFGIHGKLTVKSFKASGMLK